MTSIVVGWRWARSWAFEGMVSAVRASLRGQDLLLLAAGVTFYAALAVVPLAVVSLRLVGWVGGDGAVRSFARVIAVFLPHSDAADAGRALATAAQRVPGLVLLASVLPASLYAEGLRRALARLGVRPESGLRRALRSRLLALGGFLFVTLALLAVATVGAGLTDGGLPLLVSGYLAFVSGWALATCALVVTYRVGSSLSPRRSALIVGSAATGSMVSGMTLGLVLTLRLPLSFGRAYGGFATAGTLATVAGWMWLLHVVLLVGFALTRQLDERLAARG